MAPAVLPHAISNRDASALALLQRQRIRTNYGPSTLDMVPSDTRQLGGITVLEGAAGGDVDDELARDGSGASARSNGGRVGLEDPQLRHAVLDVPQVPPDAVLAQPEALAPAQQVLARARGLDAELAQLLRRQREQRLPVRDLGRVLLQVAPDDRQEGRHIWHEGRRRRDLGGFRR